MANTFFPSLSSVSILTAALLFTLSGCTLTEQKPPYYYSNCKNRAYTHMVFADYLNNRYHSKSPVRVGVIPFSVPANLATESTQLPGLDNQLAWGVQQNLLASEEVPIVEVFNRMGWPDKKNEFFSGNHGAIQYGRQANYDFVIIGYVPTTTDLESLSAFAKLIEVESGITLHYGKSTIPGDDPEFRREGSWLFGKKRPDKVQLQYMTEHLPRCIVMGILNENPSY